MHRGVMCKSWLSSFFSFLRLFSYNILVLPVSRREEYIPYRREVLTCDYFRLYTPLEVFFFFKMNM